MVQPPSGYLLWGCQLIHSRLIIENKHFIVTVSHTTSSIKCKHNFLLLQGVIWCSTDVIVFIAGPLILFNLQQTGAVVTAGCLTASVCRLRAYQCAPLWSRSPSPHAPFNHNSRSHVPSPLPLVVTSAFATEGQSFNTSQQERWHETMSSPLPHPWAEYSMHLCSMQINESRPSCVYFRRLLEHDTGQQKQKLVCVIMLQFMGCSMCIKWHEPGTVKWKKTTWSCLWLFLDWSYFWLLYSCLPLNLLCTV